MTKEYNSCGNAFAERVNGVLKEEFRLDDLFDNYKLLELQALQSIALYNQLRPHMSIELLTPNNANKQLEAKTW